jgi:ATP-dependent protease ClpP protease subunit
MLDKPNKDVVYAVPKSYEFTYYLSDCVLDSHEYHDLLQLLDSATEDDVIRIMINNFGGEAGTCVQIVNSIRECKALTVGVLSGNAFSAAGIIFMACDQHEVGMHTMMMIHQGIGGTEGKYSDMSSQVVAGMKRTESLYRDVFDHFLTDLEIVDVLGGKDLWLDHESIVERLEKRSKAFQEEYALEIAAMSDKGCSSPEQEPEALYTYEELIKMPTKKAMLEALGITPE